MYVMDPEASQHDILVLATGFIAIFAIITVAMGLPANAPAGDAILGTKPACCIDCTCSSDDVCRLCGSCIWTGCCSMGARIPDGASFKVIVEPRQMAGQSMEVVMVFDPIRSEEAMVGIELPPGFRQDEPAHQKVSLRPGRKTVISKTIRILEDVAEQDHILTAYAYDEKFNVLGRSQARISVYWPNP